ncbi:MAG: aspartyl/glutamyl-tRNA amidotransferase subunit C, partial [Treponema sp.]|jgi:aspartyl-tRNA(Asn)/glutamyl-tRNA(Gln) amidotransferase subunit C|nr:aspartyl/glutamyl-tRNA amidotransferase subunit C [Treponema sp.]
MNIEDLRETAALARLRLSDEELQGAFPSFQQMLGFFAAMQAASEDRDAFPVPLSAAWAGLAPNSRVVDARCLRADTPNLPNATLTTSLLNNAGERDGRFIVAPNVL